MFGKESTIVCMMVSSFKTRQNIADEYGICVRTLNRILKEKKISVRRVTYPRRIKREYIRF